MINFDAKAPEINISGIVDHSLSRDYSVCHAM